MEIESIKVTRRRMLEALSLGAGAFATMIAAWPIIGFFFVPVWRKFPPVWRNVGSLDSFKIGDTVEVTLATSSGLAWDGSTQDVGAWLRRNNETNFTVYNSKCTHLGCPVRWIPSAELFMCPCHGGVYYKDGDVAAGPPPDPLQQFPVRIQNGQVQVQWIFEQVHYAKLDSPCSGCSGAARSSQPSAGSSKQEV